MNDQQFAVLVTTLSEHTKALHRLADVFAEVMRESPTPTAETKSTPSTSEPTSEPGVSPTALTTTEDPPWDTSGRTIPLDMEDRLLQDAVQRLGGTVRASVHETIQGDQVDAPAPEPRAGEPQDPDRQSLLALKAEIQELVMKSTSMRVMDDMSRNRVFLALKSAAGERTYQAVVRALFGHETFRAVSSSEAWALQSWLRPTRLDGAWRASNPKVAEAVKVIFKLAPQPEPQPEQQPA